jgi:hypothetical protein
VFGFDIKTLSLESCFLQELCRLVLVELAWSDDPANKQQQINDVIYLKPKQNMVQKAFKPMLSYSFIYN